MCCYPFACDNGASMSSPPSLNVTPDRTAERAGNVVRGDWWILAEGERCEKHTEMSAAIITGAWCSFKSQQLRSVEGPVFNDGTGLESYAAAWWVITSLNNIIPIIYLSSWPLIPSPPSRLQHLPSNKLWLVNSNIFSLPRITWMNELFWEPWVLFTFTVMQHVIRIVSGCVC